ncbi:MAG: GLUG motif-containing protein [Bacillota bacterium]
MRFFADVGGLVGSNYGNITDSYATGEVAGENNVGGIAGSNFGNINKTYSASVVTGNTNVGGLIGNFEGYLASRK